MEFILPVGEACGHVEAALRFKMIAPPHPRSNVDHGPAGDPLPNGINFASSNIASGVRGTGPRLLMGDMDEEPGGCQLAK